jgi:hypothetical protein
MPATATALPAPATSGASACTRSAPRKECRSSGAWRTRSSGKREVTQALLEKDHHLVRAGQVILGDKGFAGKDFERFITEDLGAHLIRPDRKDEKPRFGKLGGIRQWIESVFDTLKGQLTLEDHGGRAPLKASKPASVPGSWPSLPESGTTGESTRPESAP